MTLVMLASRIAVLRFRLADVERVDAALRPAPLLLADALVDEHVGVDRRADRQHEAGDAGQGQGRVEEAP